MQVKWSYPHVSVSELSQGLSASARLPWPSYGMQIQVRGKVWGRGQLQVPEQERDGSAHPKLDVGAPS